jgi:hypothetical protein
MIKLKKKHTVFLLVLLCLVALFLIDFGISKTYKFELVECSEEVVYADNSRPVTFTVSVKQGKSPADGHSLYAVVKGGGKLQANRVKTDENGIARFTYYPYTSNIFIPAQPVRIEIIDESNSIFFEVNASFAIDIDLQEKIR